MVEGELTTKLQVMAVVVVEMEHLEDTPGVDPYTAIDDDGNTPDSGIRGSGGDGLYTQMLLRLVVLVEVAVVPVVMVLMVLTPQDLRVDRAIAGKGGLGRAAFLGDTGIPSSYGTSGPGPGRWFAGGGGGGNHDAPPPNGGAAPDGGGGGVGGVCKLLLQQFLESDKITLAAVAAVEED